MESKGVVPRNMIDEDRLEELVAEGELQAFRTHLGLPHEGEQEAEPRAAAATVKREPQHELQEASRSVRQRVDDIERSIATVTSSSSSSGRGATTPGSKRSRQEAHEEVADERAAGLKRRAAAAVEEGSRLDRGTEREWEGSIAADTEAELQMREAQIDVEAGNTGDDAGGHSLLQAGPLIFCTKCDGYALERVGARLQSTCVPSSSRATRTRLDRMRRGRHPITGDPIA